MQFSTAGRHSVAAATTMTAAGEIETGTTGGEQYVENICECEGREGSSTMSARVAGLFVSAQEQITKSKYIMICRISVKQPS